MNAAAFSALSSLMQTIIKTYMDLSGKDAITREDLETKSPEDLLKDMGIDLREEKPTGE